LVASPTLNPVIKFYDRDDSYRFFHWDDLFFLLVASILPISIDTFLCTYYGESSGKIAKTRKAKNKKFLVPEILVDES